MDSDNESKTSFTTKTKIIDFGSQRFSTVPEVRSDGQNEDLAYRLMDKLHVSEIKPYLAVGYSGIPATVIDRHLATALEVGETPPALFMHLIKQEPLWRTYKLKKAARDKDNG